MQNEISLLSLLFFVYDCLDFAFHCTSLRSQSPGGKACMISSRSTSTSSFSCTVSFAPSVLTTTNGEPFNCVWNTISFGSKYFLMRISLVVASRPPITKRPSEDRYQRNFSNQCFFLSSLYTFFCFFNSTFSIFFSVS